MGGRFRIVCYRRIEELNDSVTWEEAKKERAKLQIQHPENFYIIEGVNYEA